jgi:hypothetical protein
VIVMPPRKRAKTENQESHPGQLVDRFGHLHSEAVLKNWSAGAIRALGIRPLDEKGGDA